MKVICDWCEQEYVGEPRRLLYYCSKSCLSAINIAGGMAPLELKRAKIELERVKKELKNIREEHNRSLAELRKMIDRLEGV